MLVIFRKNIPQFLVESIHDIVPIDLPITMDIDTEKKKI